MKSFPVHFLPRKKFITESLAILSAAIVLSCLPPMEAAADYEIATTCQVQADDSEPLLVKALDYGYDHNTYLSLRDMAMVLENTDKAFSLEITRNSISLTLDQAYLPVGEENTPWAEEENPDVTLRRNTFTVNGQNLFYYTLILGGSSGNYDCFMMAADLAMILDLDITSPREGVLQIDTRGTFSVSPAALEEDGYFYGVNSVLVGDATTGDIYYQYHSDAPYPIASTSKLMTCLLAMDALSAGEISLEDMVTVSSAAQALSASDDGVIPMEEGQQIALRDLLTASLLPSSNECALCLAEYIAGSEEAFVAMMNQKALELGLSQAFFFNSNGLPVYTESPIPSKCQNRMSAEDMFRFVSYLLKVYPQITDITSRKTAVLESLSMEVRNTNPLLHNLPETTGLKTGTTNKAGACLVTSLSADAGLLEHDLVVILLGAEDSVERGRVSALLARYALDTFEQKTGSPAGDEAPGNGISEDIKTEAGLPASAKTLPTHAEAAVDLILQEARRQQASSY